MADFLKKNSDYAICTLMCALMGTRFINFRAMFVLTFFLKGGEAKLCCVA